MSKFHVDAVFNDPKFPWLEQHFGKDRKRLTNVGVSVFNEIMLDHRPEYGNYITRSVYNRDERAFFFDKDGVLLGQVHPKGLKWFFRRLKPEIHWQSVEDALFALGHDIERVCYMVTTHISDDQSVLVVYKPPKGSSIAELTQKRWKR